MVFSGIVFLYYFLPVMAALYFLVPKRLKNAALLLGSLFFYAWGEPKYVLVMIGVIVPGYGLGLLVERYREERAGRIVCALSVLISLSFLIYFKYADFFVTNINALTGWDLPLLHVALPIGISFYTFQMISYTIDVYRGGPALRNIFSLALYIAMFPQLIAGPIVRYSDMADQLVKREYSWELAATGIRRFVIGLSKKILLADQLWALCSAFRASDEPSVLFCWLYAAASMLYIYFDFSGYSDMAIGLGAIFGFRIPENFRYPFISASITEFWRRWHMSLGTWFRDYVYIPLGGNRHGKMATYRNLMIVFILTGFWHGANWTFILWGLFHGIFLILERGRFGTLLDKLPGIIKRIYTLVVVLIGWVFFRCESLIDALHYLRAMFAFDFSDLHRLTVTECLDREFWFLFVLSLIGSLPLIPVLRKKFSENAALGMLAEFGLLGSFAFAVCYMVGADFNPFIYFRF